MIPPVQQGGEATRSEVCVEVTARVPGRGDHALVFTGRLAEVVMKFAAEVHRWRESLSRQHVGKIEVDMTQEVVLVRRGETSAPHKYLTPKPPTT